jgi:glucuronosyltransferase
MLGLPFGNDQRANIVKAEVEGYGLALGWDTINTHALEKALKRLTDDPRCCTYT